MKPRSSDSARWWDGICGHEAIGRRLQRSMERGATSHALVLAGPARVGKTTIAWLIARSLLCDRQGQFGACGQCVACADVNAGLHPDLDVYRPVLIRERRGAEEGVAGGRRPWVPAPEYMPSSVLPIELMRQMRERAARRPARGSRKVIIIEEAEQLSVDAQDAILKTIEEPGEGVFILLIAHNLSALRPTVVSRCRVLSASRQPVSIIVEWLCKSKGLDQAQALSLAKRANGRPGSAARRADHPQFGEIDERMDRMIAALGAKPMVGALRLTEEFSQLASALFEADMAADPRPVSLPKTGLGSRLERGAAIRLLEELSIRVASLPAGFNQVAYRGAMFNARRALMQNANLPLTMNVMMMHCLLPSGQPALWSESSRL